MEKEFNPSVQLGVLGGGQLGRMLIQEAVNLNLAVHVLDPSSNAPCAEIATRFVQGNFADYETVLQFGKNLDVITIEIEHVNLEALEELERMGKRVYPKPAALRIIKDKGLQKLFYATHNIPTAPFVLIENKDEATQHLKEGPFMQKMRTGGYDGKGVTPFRNEKDLDQAFDAPSVLEKMVDFEKELAVIVARNEEGEISAFPLVEMEFNSEANLVEFIFSPANVSIETASEATEIAKRLVEKLDHVGLLAVELFLTKEGHLLVNEVAPRPHNSGHHTIEACYTSQYGQHLRAILNLPLGDTALRSAGVMINLLGEKGYSGKAVYAGLKDALNTSGVYVHLYGKEETKPFRKMGH
ncbi:MAG: 5-(carboxyamino)imidazole ribonucleotide synthase, partial [Bacteroidota bacterium]